MAPKGFNPQTQVYPFTNPQRPLDGPLDPSERMQKHMAARQITQGQVPDGMVANLPWGTPLDRWSDRMVERGLLYLAGGLKDAPHGEGNEFFPHLTAAMSDQANLRGLTVIRSW